MTFASKPLSSVEEAIEYKKKITDGCTQLGELAAEACLGTHAAIFYAIAGAINDDPEEMQTISDMMGMYMENRLARGFDDFPASQEPG